MDEGRVWTFPSRRREAGRRLALLVAAVALLSVRGEATVEMQDEAKKLGLPVVNCLYCHASAHSIDVMKKKASSLGINEGNCLACHGANIPAKLNERGRWLVAEKAKRRAKAFDMAWLKDYVEPTPAPSEPGASERQGSHAP